MNSFWNKNVSLFEQRFPALVQQLGLSAQRECEFDFWELLPSKSQDLTAKENGSFLHSSYAPKREAETLVKQSRTSETYGAVFFSMGLGYAPLKWAELYPEDTIIIVEPNPDYFIAALKYNDFTALFKQKSLIIALQAPAHSVIQLIESTTGFNHAAFIQNGAQTAHDKNYFDSIHALIERNKQKVKINNSTLEKFSSLWLNNSCRNLKYFAELDGVNIFKDRAPKDLPAVLISAGPSLQEILPYLKEIKKRAVIIAVDTALRALLKAGVEPDFIILVDPQYYAYRHIAGLKSPSSILITESAAWPAVYRFECKKIILTSSLFPLGQYFEKHLGTKGTLGAGGSVSTTAWDFARYAGFTDIYCAGLDLGYPLLQSHIRGSTFEEKTHASSRKLHPAETALSTTLFLANKKLDKDYEGKTLFTDDKMKMFAWWFESKAQQFKEVHSYSLNKSSLYIPGFSYRSVQSLLDMSVQTEKRIEFLTCPSNTTSDSIKAFDKVFNEFLEGMQSLYDTAVRGIRTAEKALLSTRQSVQYTQELQKIDNSIMTSQFKDIASLVFPTEQKLNSIMEQTALPEDPVKAGFIKSKIIYGLIKGAIQQYLKKF